MGEKDWAAILTFGEETALKTDFTQDKSAIAAVVSALKPTDNKTQLYNGILKTLDVAKRQSADLPLRRVVVVLSDGVDDFPAGATVAEVTERVAQSGVPMFAIGVEGAANKQAIQELGGVARLSGGEIIPAKKDALRSGYEIARKRILNGYVAGAALTADIANGSMQGLILTVRQNEIAVEDSLDVRLKAVAASQPTLAPAPVEPTEEPAVPAVAEAPKDSPASALLARLTSPATLIVVGCVLGLGALAAAVFLLLRRRQRLREQEKIDELKRKSELDRLITDRSDRISGGGKGDRTTSLDDRGALDKTVPLSLEGSVRRLMLTLTEFNAPSPRRYTVPLQNRITVGRRADQNTVAIDEKTISGAHCVFELDQDMLYLKDLGSTNGTFLIERKMAKPVGRDERVMVKSGDVVRLGKTDFEVIIHEA